MKRVGKYYPWLVIGLWAVAFLLFFQLAYPYHFFYKEQNQLFLLSADYVSTYQGSGWLARLAGDFLTQYFYYRYAGAAILAVLLLVIGALLYAGLCRLHIHRWVALPVALAAMTVEAGCQLHYNYPLSGTVRDLGMAATLWLAGMAYGPLRRWMTKKKVGALAFRGIPVMAGLLLLLPAIRLFCFDGAKWHIAAPEWEIERMLAVDNEYRFGNYDRVVSLVEAEQEPMREMKFFYNLVMAQRGELPDKVLRYVPNELGTLHRIGPDTPIYTVKNMNELYWVLGDMTFTERAAMMANVFSRENRNIRMVKRLAETNLVSGDTLAARKYLRLLEQTVAYADWARQAPQIPLYRQKALLRNRQDTLAVTDNSHFIMMQLLDSNPDNTVALDYMLCTELLLKDIANFKRDYDRYCAERPRLKRLYQEALCIWLAGTNAPQEEWQRLIKMPDVVQRFAEYNRQRGSRAFRDTYWYYFDTAKTPEQP